MDEENLKIFHKIGKYISDLDLCSLIYKHQTNYYSHFNYNGTFSFYIMFFIQLIDHHQLNLKNTNLNNINKYF